MWKVTHCAPLNTCELLCEAEKATHLEGKAATSVLWVTPNEASRLVWDLEQLRSRGVGDAGHESWHEAEPPGVRAAPSRRHPHTAASPPTRGNGADEFPPHGVLRADVKSQSGAGLSRFETHQG